MSTTEPAIRRAQAIVPYLCVQDGAAALEHYRDVFGAVETLRVTGDDGRLGHAEFTIGDARFMLADAYPEIGVVDPRSLGGSPVTLHLEVDDADSTFDRAVAAGAEGVRPPADQAHGSRTATLVDPFGHRWMISQLVEELSVAEYAAREDPSFEVSGTAGEGHGDAAPSDEAPAPVELGYLVMSTPAVERAGNFFASLFGWHVEPGNAGEGFGHVANTRLPMGFAPPGGEPVGIYFRVADLGAFAERVEQLGGEVLSRAEHASGRTAECSDDQGMRFNLLEPAPGY